VVDAQPASSSMPAVAAMDPCLEAGTRLMAGSLALVRH
jgi:hypothetical protein